MPQPKKCQLESVLSDSVIALLTATPANEVIRTLVLAAIKKPIPSEAQTFEQVRDWIEANIDPVTVMAPVKPAAGGITGTVQVILDRSGTCYYTEHMQGRDNYTVSAEELGEIMDIATIEHRDFNWVLSEVAALLKEAAGEDQPGTEQVSVDYSDYEDDGDGDCNTHYEIRDSLLGARVRQWALTNRASQYALILGRP